MSRADLLCISENYNKIIKSSLVRNFSVSPNVKFWIWDRILEIKLFLDKKIQCQIQFLKKKNI